MVGFDWECGRVGYQNMVKFHEEVENDEILEISSIFLLHWGRIM